MKYKKIALLTIIILLVLTPIIVSVVKRDKQEDKQTDIVVSISPIKYIVDRISGSSLSVEVLVPLGANPESYEPTPQQILSVSKAKLLITTGLIDFEQELVSKIKANSDVPISDLSTNVNLIYGEGHNHSHSHDHAHTHAIDPHIWMSPKQLRKMAEVTYRALSHLNPNAGNFERNYSQLIDSIDSLDVAVSRKIAGSNIKYFIIYHPALTYYSRDYNIVQVALEDEGKEPSVERLRNVIRNAKQDNITKILVQKEFDKTIVETVAREIGADIVQIDPLDEDVLRNILLITETIVGDYEQ